ncbi:hypothetical protein C2R86_03715 [Helicobacter pylori]|nr:hypothetical protein C2R86_03715 [Helicobacter pylori]
MILSFYHSIILSFYHSSNHSIIQAIIQSFNHSTIQATLPYFYRFYQNRFKNPLFFTILSFIPSCIPPFINPCINPFIPPFINPHHLFKKFDSISPIFKPVGLTELNSKEK